MIQFHPKVNVDEIEDLEAVAMWLSDTLTHFDKEEGEINIIVISDEDLLEMNKQHLQHDYLTDIITFDFTVGDVISGDLFISADRVRENAGNFGVESKREFLRVFAHGLLHLLGFDDKNDLKRTEMRKQEDFLLNLYPF